MQPFSATVRLSAVALLLSTTAASADLTGAQVWNQWKSMAETAGQTVTTGSETEDGDTYTVSDVTLTIEQPEATVVATFDEMVFTEQGDGTVSISTAPETRMVMNMRPEYGEAVDLTMTMTHTDLVVVASGDDAAQTYEYTAAQIDVVVDEIIAEGEPEAAEIRFTGTDLSGEYVNETNDNRVEVNGTFALGNGEFVASVRDEGTDAEIDLRISMADIDVDSRTTVLNEPLDPDDLAASIRAGFAASGEITHGQMTVDMNVLEYGTTTEIASSVESGTLDFGMGEDGLLYTATAENANVTVSGSDIPFPQIAMTMAEAGFAFRMPVLATEEPGEFGFGMSMRDFTISDEVWAMFDPAGSLPRDPATVALDLSGTGRWLIDIMSPEAEAMSEPPGELNDVTLNELEVSVAGASLTGDGAFTFDNSDTETFDGLPRPEGSVELNLTGGNGLLDTLIEMGLVPEEDAMGVRMMMGLFARPGDGEDELVSIIEINADGEVLANGQRLR